MRVSSNIWNYLEQLSPEQNGRNLSQGADIREFIKYRHGVINVFLWSVHSNDSIILASITVKQQAKYIHLSSLTPYHLFLWISNQASHTLLLESKPFERTHRLPTRAFPCTPPHSTPLLPPIITSKLVLSLLGLKRCLFPGFFPVPLSISLTHPRCLSFTSTGVSWWGLCSLTVN